MSEAPPRARYCQFVATQNSPARPILQRMHAELKSILGTPEMRERLELLGMTIRASSPEEFARHIAAEMELWGKVVRDRKISAVE